MISLSSAECVNPRGFHPFQVCGFRLFVDFQPFVMRLSLVIIDKSVNIVLQISCNRDGFLD